MDQVFENVDIAGKTGNSQLNNEELSLIETGASSLYRPVSYTLYRLPVLHALSEWGGNPFHFSHLLGNGYVR